MLIFGWGNRATLVESGTFDCPVCKTKTNCRCLQHRRWMTFFFIPVIPISKSYETLVCEKCQTSIPIDAVHGEPASKVVPYRLSLAAMVALLGSAFALLAFCIYSVSIPLALVSVLLGHATLKEARRDYPRFDGRWQARTALALGYPALILSMMIGIYAVSQKTRPVGRDSSLVQSSMDEMEESLTTSFGLSESSNEAFKNAEYEIASKRDKPPGRGNSLEAIELANTFASRMKEVCDEAFTINRKPLLQLSDGEFLTYCQLQEDRCLFLVHVPSYRKFTKDAKKTLSELAWIVAQSTTAGKLRKPSKLAVALRGVLTYGDILVGESVPSTEDKLTGFSTAKKEDLFAFFEMTQPKPVTPAPIAPAVSTPAVSTPAPEAKSIELREPVKVARSPKPKEKSQPEEPKFSNQIPIELARTIENESWGTTSMAWSPDSKWLAVGKLDEKILLYDAANGKQVNALHPLKNFGEVTALAFGSDGNYLIAGGYQGQILHWKIGPEGRLSEEGKGFRFESQVERLIASPKYRFVMGYNSKGTIAWQPFDTNASQPRLLQEFNKEVLAVWLPSSGDQAKATDGERWITFSLRSAEVGDSEPLGLGRARYACFSASGNRLALAESNEVSLHDLASQSGPRKIQLPKRQRVHAVSFHPNENWIAVGTRGEVGVLDFDRGDWIAFVSTESIQYVAHIGFSPDGTNLAATSQSARDSIKIYRLGVAPEMPIQPDGKSSGVQNPD